MSEHIFITGANRGIGLELVRQYLKRDDTMVFAACRKPSPEFPQSEHLVVVPLEVTDSSAIQNAYQLVKQYSDTLDILINNAGIEAERQSLKAIHEATMLQVFRVNSVAPLMITRVFIDLLSKSPNPRLINISSEMGSIAARNYGGSYAYSTSKSALNMITRGLAADLRGIITVALDPGWVKTDMGGQGAELTVHESASGILKVIDSLTPADSGEFLRWDGKYNPW